MLTIIATICTTLFWLAIISIALSPILRRIGMVYEAAMSAFVGLAGIALSIVFAFAIATSFDPPVSSLPGMLLTHLAVGPVLLGQLIGVHLDDRIGGLDNWMFLTAMLAGLAIMLGVTQMRAR